MRGSGDDLENYYHKCKVSRERALTNAIGRTLPETELEGTAALAAARARLAASGRSTRQPRRWQPCVSALPMGDLNAVDYAQTGHMNILRAAGGLRDETLLRYRAPVPRSRQSP